MEKTDYKAFSKFQACSVFKFAILGMASLKGKRWVQGQNFNVFTQRVW